MQSKQVRGFIHSEASGQRIGYEIKFGVEWLNSFTADGLNPGKPTPEVIIREIDALRIHIPFIPNDSEVVKGWAAILLNGSIRKQFRILPQKSEKAWVEAYPEDKGFSMIATNFEN